MNHLILGYGYCGFYLAKHLLQQGQSVTAISRQLNPLFKLNGLEHVATDVTNYCQSLPSNTIVYYMIPPPSHGLKDTILQHYLQSTAIKPAKVIYFGSSGVYGCHQGQLINEQAPCHLHHDRQYRRLDAEKQWQDFCHHQAIDCVILRIAGIYGPDRLPIAAAEMQSAVINADEAPLSNHIYIHDLSKIAALLALHQHAKGIYNVADGHPSLMGSLQQHVAAALNLPKAPQQSMEQLWQQASPMKREFMQASKQLSIKRLQDTLGSSFTITPLSVGINESLIAQGRLL